MSSNRAQKARDRLAQNDVTVMRSYLEVDVAEWLSENEIPFAYEAFTIPSVVSIGQDRWNETVQGIRDIGDGEDKAITLPNGDEMSAFEVLSLWTDIYDKHGLQDEQITVPVRRALSLFDKQLLLPDFAIYKDAGKGTADDDFAWGEFDYLVEVSGLYGVGLPDESTDEDWWTWYRVSAVAFKELMYRLLGLGEKVYWVVPNQAYIEGVTEGLSMELRDDPQYIIMNTTQAGIQLHKLADAIGATVDASDAGLSPPIQPTKYNRPLDNSGEFGPGEITPVRYTYTDTDYSEIKNNERVVGLENEFIVYHGQMGDVYLADGEVFVRESQWRGTNMIMLREYVLDCLRILSNNGIVEGLRVV